MDEKDREIIRLLQGDFPLTPEPYRAIGDKLWLDEMSVISRIANLIQTGVIRHFGPFFDSRKLGYTGALMAMDVPADQIEDVAELVNSYAEITHNYLRDGTPNMWFTVIARDAARRDQILKEIRARSGIRDILMFPARRLFKVRVDLD
ncbi:MAG: Heme biosynthesis protein related to NirD and NirG [Candidatus Ozemobacter sibiricus]|jgi:DNA-binding Lrp family transcriptional regulator|uniref:siroheme decarboxylase n=1 Tax=Candidatus Ozemobacter sibiricus TaxID=2268124 RepID=A0A367ZRU1_9BACT|nr:MAG: Heme biosynthesis protein related to NirD and NirG [Candidatus Ozemobacter sibiricus]